LQANACHSSSSRKSSSLSSVKKQQFPLAAMACSHAAPAALLSRHSQLMLLSRSEASGWISHEPLAHRAGEAKRTQDANEVEERCKAVLNGGSVERRLDAFLEKLVGDGNALTPAQVRDRLREKLGESNALTPAQLRHALHHTRTNEEKADAAVSRRQEDVGGSLHRARDAFYVSVFGVGEPGMWPRVRLHSSLSKADAAGRIDVLSRSLPALQRSAALHGSLLTVGNVARVT